MRAPRSSAVPRPRPPQAPRRAPDPGLRTATRPRWRRGSPRVRQTGRPPRGAGTRSAPRGAVPITATSRTRMSGRARRAWPARVRRRERQGRKRELVLEGVHRRKVCLPIHLDATNDHEDPGGRRNQPHTGRRFSGPAVGRERTPLRSSPSRAGRCRRSCSSTRRRTEARSSGRPCRARATRAVPDGHHTRPRHTACRCWARRTRSRAEQLARITELVVGSAERNRCDVVRKPIDLVQVVDERVAIDEDLRRELNTLDTVDRSVVLTVPPVLVFGVSPLEMRSVSLYARVDPGQRQHFRLPLRSRRSSERSASAGEDQRGVTPIEHDARSLPGLKARAVRVQAHRVQRIAAAPLLPKPHLNSRRAPGAGTATPRPVGPGQPAYGNDVPYGQPRELLRGP